MTGHITRYLGRQTRFDQLVQVISPEMLLHCRYVFKSGRILLILSQIVNDFACFFFPLIDQFRITGDLDTAPVLLKTHPAAKTLFEQRANYLLKGMIIRRSEQSPGKAAPGYGSEIALNRLLLNDFACIKVIFFLVESDPFQDGRLHGYRTVVAELIDHDRIVQGADPDSMALRAFEEHPGQTE